MQCGARLSVTRQGARFLETQRFRAFPRPTFTRQFFLISCTARECEFFTLYLLLQLVFILLSTFVKILNLARPYVLSREQQSGFLANTWLQNLKFKKG
jgi:hypothetical protein